VIYACVNHKFDDDQSKLFDHTYLIVNFLVRDHGIRNMNKTAKYVENRSSRNIQINHSYEQKVKNGMTLSFPLRVLCHEYNGFYPSFVEIQKSLPTHMSGERAWNVTTRRSKESGLPKLLAVGCNTFFLYLLE